MFSRRVVSALVVAAVLAFATRGIASNETRDDESPRAVGVMIDSRPDHAEVEIDGKFVGTTPLPYRLSPGQHRITLSRPHYAKWSRELTVAPQISTRVTAILEGVEKAPCKK